MKRIPIDVIDRYMVGSSSQEECVEVERWLAEPDHQVLLRALRKHEGESQLLSDIRGEDRTWERVWFRAVSGGRPVTHTSKVRSGINPQPLRRGLWYTVAGVACAAAVIVLGWHGGASGRDRLGQVAMSQYVTGNGERASITLPDGNLVALNVGSRLEVPADYAAGNHMVRLMGEALFTVTHHQSAPFIVMVGPTAARVLGTSFVARRYAADSVTTIAVREGRVAVQTAVVTANRQVQIGPTGVTHWRSADPARFSFVTGVLTLDGLRLSDAILELNRWYDADIRLGDSALGDRTLMGEVQAGTVADLQQFFAVSFNMRVVRQGRVLTLFSRH